jgi:membrane protein
MDRDGSVWAAPRNERRDPLWSRLRSLMMLVVLGSAAIASRAVSAIGHGAASFALINPAGLTLMALAINAVIWVALFTATTARHRSWPQVLPGAPAAAAVWQLLQWFGAHYVSHVVSHVVKSASATNSIVAVVLGLLAFLSLVSIILVLCAEINVVRVDRRHPRALLPPFTDNVELTPPTAKHPAGGQRPRASRGFRTFRSPSTRPRRRLHRQRLIIDPDGWRHRRLPCAI